MVAPREPGEGASPEAFEAPVVAVYTFSEESRARIRDLGREVPPELAAEFPPETESPAPRIVGHIPLRDRDRPPPAPDRILLAPDGSLRLNRTDGEPLPPRVVLRMVELGVVEVTDQGAPILQRLRDQGAGR
jgi:hypothetical protein